MPHKNSGIRRGTAVRLLTCNQEVHVTGLLHRIKIAARAQLGAGCLRRWG